MADRSDFYYDQNVTQAELDQCFSDMENADRNMVADHNATYAGSVPHAPWGVLNGLGVAATGTPSQSVVISNGVAYDAAGQRIAMADGPVTLDLSTHFPPTSDSRFVRVYIEFARALSDPRTDGLGNPVDYRQTEYYELTVQEGTIAAYPTPPTPIAGKVCIATILLNFGGTIITGNIGLNGATATDADGSRTIGGFAVAHGKQNSFNRPLLWEPGISTQRVIDVNGNSIGMRGGDIYMGEWNDSSGGDVYMERGSLYNAGQVRVAGLIQDGGGYWYSNPSSGNYKGEPLQAINKYLSFDPALFQPAGQGLTVHDKTLSPNHWWVDTQGPGWPVMGPAWETRVTISSGFFYQTPIFCPLVGIPFRSQLVDFEWEVDVVTNRVELEFGTSVCRRGIDRQDIVQISNGGTIPTTALTVGDRTVNAGTLDHLARPDLYCYFAVFWIKAVAPATDLSAGIYLTGCRLTYQIREASGEYYHPTL